MNDQTKALFDQARRLSPQEREELAEHLLDSLDPAGIDQAWAAEARQRWEEHIASGAQPVDALAAVDEARQALDRSREK